MARRETDFSKSLDELQGFAPGDCDDAPTGLVRDIILARRKPLKDLRSDEIGCLVVQLDGLPFILDLAISLLDADPLFDGGYYPGDVLSALIRADASVWTDRPEYLEKLEQQYRSVMARPIDEKDAFLDSLGISDDPPN
jgi:CDI immunity proteins